MEKMSLTWQAPEYHHYKRSTDWFWAVGIIALSITILAFFFGNGLFGVLIILSAGILIFYSLREPDIISYEINQRGVIVGDVLHPYLTLESFWIETRFDEPKIILKSKKTLQPFIIIPIHDESVEDIASVLAEFIDEKELAEPASHKIMEYLGF